VVMVTAAAAAWNLPAYSQLQKSDDYTNLEQPQSVDGRDAVENFLTAAINQKAREILDFPSTIFGQPVGIDSRAPL